MYHRLAFKSFSFIYPISESCDKSKFKVRIRVIKILALLKVFRFGFSRLERFYGS